MTFWCSLDLVFPCNTMTTSEEKMLSRRRSAKSLSAGANYKGFMTTSIHPWKALIRKIHCSFYRRVIRIIGDWPCLQQASRSGLLVGLPLYGRLSPRSRLHPTCNHGVVMLTKCIHAAVGHRIKSYNNMDKFEEYFLHAKLCKFSS